MLMMNMPVKHCLFQYMSCDERCESIATDEDAEDCQRCEETADCYKVTLLTDTFIFMKLDNYSNLSKYRSKIKTALHLINEHTS